MEKKKFNLKKWYKENKRIIDLVGITVVSAAITIVFVKGITKLAAEEEKRFLEMVDNNLKLVKEGEIFEVIVDRSSDDYTKTVTTKAFTKLNGERLYLGRRSTTTELSETEQIGKQLKNIGSSIDSAISRITKK